MAVMGAVKMKPVILCDIDGTIALRGERGPHDHEQAMEDAVSWPIIKLCDVLYMSKKFDIILISGRDESYRDITEYWLNTHNLLPYRQHLFMRPLNDNRPDEVVKREIYEKEIWPRYMVWYVLDDRNKVVKMWREIGLTCLQVADGDF